MQLIDSSLSVKIGDGDQRQQGEIEAAALVTKVIRKRAVTKIKRQPEFICAGACRRRRTEKQHQGKDRC